MSTGEGGHMAVADRGTRKRRVGAKNGGKSKSKKFKTTPSSSDRFKVTTKNKKLFQKRARDYNSDDDEEDEPKKAPEVTNFEKIFTDANMGPNYDVIEDEEGSDQDDHSDGEDHGEIESGITRFSTDDGCNAFKTAFRAIMKKTKGDDTLGPVLSFRIEKVVLRSSATQAKIIGTIVSISGALVVVLYKGPKVLDAASSSSTISLYQQLTSSDSSWILGGVLLVSEYLLISVWYILQTQVMEMYPEETTVVFLYSLCATLISAPVCLYAEKDLASFFLKPDISLASVMYTGGLVSSFGSVIHTWGLHLKGPVYISLFKPLSIVIAVAMGAIFLGDALHIGSVIGSVILSLGFYTVIWGKAREDATKTLASSEQSPLLLTHTIEDEASSLICD